MSTFTAPTQRIDLMTTIPRTYANLHRLDAAVELDEDLREIVKLRASQLNGCTYCVDMHWRDARERGIDERKLATVVAWEESPLFDARERAALALTDAATRLTEGGVDDDVWAAAREQFEEEELSQLVLAIAVINAYNRIGVTTRKALPELS